MKENNGWCVFEYAAPDSRTALVTLFRNYDHADTEFSFRARGLDCSLNYTIAFDNEGYSAEMDGFALVNTGIRIRLERALSSQMLIIKAKC